MNEDEAKTHARRLETLNEQTGLEWSMPFGGEYIAEPDGSALLDQARVRRSGGDEVEFIVDAWGKGHDREVVVDTFDEAADAVNELVSGLLREARDDACEALGAYRRAVGDGDDTPPFRVAFGEYLADCEVTYRGQPLRGVTGAEVRCDNDTDEPVLTLEVSRYDFKIVGEGSDGG